MYIKYVLTKIQVVQKRENRRLDTSAGAASRRRHSNNELNFFADDFLDRISSQMSLDALFYQGLKLSKNPSSKIVFERCINSERTYIKL